jgi:hypothetical protein
VLGDPWWLRVHDEAELTVFLPDLLDTASGHGVQGQRHAS